MTRTRRRATTTDPAAEHCRCEHPGETFWTYLRRARRELDEARRELAAAEVRLRDAERTAAAMEAHIPADWLAFLARRRLDGGQGPP
jgi:hypothetical protein